MFDDDGAYARVVVNGRGQLALWPLAVGLPRGWQRTAMAGPRVLCSRYIDRVAQVAPPAGSGPRSTLVELLDRLGRRAAGAPAIRDEHSRLDVGELVRGSIAVADRLRG